LLIGTKHPSMAAQPAGTASALLTIAPGPSHVLRSSAHLKWQEVLFEKHLSSPGERVGAYIDRHVISMLCGRPARFEYCNAMPCLEAVGTITIMPTGAVPNVRLHTSAELLYCAFEEAFIRRVLAEMERRPGGLTAFRSGLRDSAVQRLLNLLLDELDAKAPSGRLYVDSLAYALAMRYVSIDGAHKSDSEPRTSALPHRILSRVRERIESNLHTDVSLDALAEESGYSRAHFLRMFRVATGITPHQYVLAVRLDHAQQWLKRKGANLIEISAQCGFSSQSHMTTVFRKRLGVTPAEFRRSQ
jgi:AraC family transcriptional regulator